MGYVFRRGGKLWLGFKDANGKHVQKATGLPVGQEAKAKVVLKDTERLLAAGAEFGGPPTVSSYAAKWLKERHARGLSMADDDETRMNKHVLPRIGSYLIADVRTKHIRDFVRALRSEPAPGGTQPLAPRTIRHVYGMIHSMFHDAQVDELITSNPCVLKRDDLPKKVDKNPEWRRTAVFTHEEVASLLFDQRIPMDRRILYMLMVVAGLRAGEVANLPWRLVDRNEKPLGRIIVATAFNSKLGVSKAVKTEVPRWVPLHPVLATVLEDWRTDEWERFAGRPPTDDDLVIPRESDLKPRRNNKIWAAFQSDLKLLGLRERRVHDLRRTFVSLWREDGGREDLVKLVSHGPPRDIMDIYTSIGWPKFCAEMLKFQVAGKAETLVTAPVAGDEGFLHSSYSPQNSAKLQAILDAGAGLEPAAFGL